MKKIDIRFGNDQLALSESRIRSFLNHDNEAAQRMGWFDTLKDTVFHNSAKQQSLRNLAAEFEASKGLSALSKFAILAQYAETVDRHQFTVTKGGTFESPTLDYRIKNTVVKQDLVNSSDLKAIEARLGVVTGLGDMKGDHVANWLAENERPDLPEERKQVQVSAFSGGGVHKKFDPNSGLLQAQDKTGIADFNREKLIADRAQTSASLQRYVSTQQKLELEKEDFQEQFPNLDFKDMDRYATVTLYNEHVTSDELDGKISTLTSGEAHSVLMQTVDMARVLYQEGISHQDLHMHNLMVHQPKDPQKTTSPSRSLTSASPRSFSGTSPTASTTSATCSTNRPRRAGWRL